MVIETFIGSKLTLERTRTPLLVPTCQSRMFGNLRPLFGREFLHPGGSAFLPTQPAESHGCGVLFSGHGLPVYRLLNRLSKFIIC